MTGILKLKFQHPKNSTPLAKVLNSVSSEHISPIKCNNLVLNVEMETGFYKDAAQQSLTFCCSTSKSPILSISFSCDFFLSRTSPESKQGK